MPRDKWFIIDGHAPDRTHMIQCEVSGTREATQVLDAYIARYPEYTFTVKVSD